MRVTYTTHRWCMIHSVTMATHDLMNPIEVNNTIVTLLIWVGISTCLCRQ